MENILKGNNNQVLISLNFGLINGFETFEQKIKKNSVKQNILRDTPNLKMK